MSQYAPLRAFMAGLRDAGLEEIVLSPGSRSTPVALCAAELGLRRRVILDERSAAYFALGIGLASGRPAAVLCTSGTAAANFLPAMVEATYGGVPLIALTADRPPELRDVGAHQTIDQVRLYGSHAKWSVELPTAGGSAGDLAAYARAAALRAWSVARARPFGPVHVNIPLREPLLPEETPPPAPRTAARTAPPVERSAADLLAEAVERLRGARRCLIVAGPHPPSRPLPDLAGLSRALDAPLLADPLSGQRTVPLDVPGRLDASDLYLRSEDLRAALRPDLVLHVGGLPTSKAVQQWLGGLPPATLLRLPGESPDRDPMLAANLRLTGTAQDDVAELLRHLAGASHCEDYRRAFVRADRAARAAAESFIAAHEDFEGGAIATLAALLGPGDQLFCGSSMPVRDVDGFLPAGGGQRILAMRGASGIDGVTSAAFGAASAWPGRTALAVGDLSFLHDLTGLQAAARCHVSLTVLLTQNDGGGIFSFLPQSGLDVFEELFGTPHGLDFAPAVAMFGGRLHRPHGRQELRAVLVESLAAEGLDVVEFASERRRNVALHEEVFAAAQSAARAALEHA